MGEGIIPGRGGETVPSGWSGVVGTTTSVPPLRLSAWIWALDASRTLRRPLGGEILRISEYTGEKH